MFLRDVAQVVEGAQQAQRHVWMTQVPLQQTDRLLHRLDRAFRR